MKLKDIADMKEYLEERCYCPGEIYDMTGFFFHVFSPETECKLLIEGTQGLLHGSFVLAKCNETYPMQIIYIEHTDGKVDSCIRVDATPNNVEQIVYFMQGKIDKMIIDEFEDSDTAKALSELMEIADAIMIS